MNRPEWFCRQYNYDNRPGNKTFGKGTSFIWMTYWGHCDHTRKRVVRAAGDPRFIVVRVHRFVLYVRAPRLSVDGSFTAYKTARLLGVSRDRAARLIDLLRGTASSGAQHPASWASARKYRLDHAGA